MTTFSKILALFTTAACFAFLGFVMVSLIAGPNWQGETHEYENYQFEYSGGENPTWSVTRRDDGQAVGGGSPILPKKIVDVLNEIKQQQREQITFLDEGDEQTNTRGINDLEPYIQTLDDALHKDVAALEENEARLHANLQAVQSQLEETTREVTDTITEIESIYIKAQRRRGDIYRLQNVVAELETDRYRSVEHQEKLRDIWERYQGVIQHLKQRKAILERQLEQRSNYDTPPAVNVNASGG